MATCTYNCLMSVINIGNSIIGVSILAMPYCFRKCGILLSLVLIFISGILTRLACYLLLKSAIMARRRNIEILAFHFFGSTGKFLVEMSVIGFLIGVCIAFFVVIGDLGPPLAAELLNVQNSPNLRSNVLILMGLCVALPLGMLRKIDSLTSFSALSIAFYLCLILKIFAEAVPNLAINEWWYEVNWWKSEGILPCLPIFSMALSCQTQLFEFFDTLNDPSLKKMQSVVSGAVHLCSVVYIMVGLFGYIAFHDKAITGNVLVLLTPSVITQIIKLGFIFTVAVSFPLCLFPCRSSLHSLLFKQGFGHHDINVGIIPDHRFRILTISLVIFTIGVAIMLPHIEFVLGIIGSTIGTLICLIFPAVMFIHDTSKNTTEKRMAQMLMSIGIFILVACTYSTLQESNSRPEPISNHMQNIIQATPAPVLIVNSSPPDINQSPVIPVKEEAKLYKKEKEEKTSDVQQLSDDQKRLEPPVPQEPDVKVEQNAELDPQALQKEDKELQKDVNLPSANSIDLSKKAKDLEKQEKLLQKLEEQHKEQKLILEQQKQVLEELKLHKESHEEQRKIELAEKHDVKTINKIVPLEKEEVKIKPKVVEQNGFQKEERIKDVQHDNLQQSDLLKNIQPEDPAKNLSVELLKQNVHENNKNQYQNNKHENVKIISRKKPYSEKNETSGDIKLTIQKGTKNISLNVPQHVQSNVVTVPVPKKQLDAKNAIQDTFKNADTHIKQRETLGKKTEYDATMPFSKDDDINVAKMSNGKGHNL